jgi:hypothetical protein
MEQLIYTSFKCKIKLSYQELMALNDMLGRVRYEENMNLTRKARALAMMEYAIKKRMEFTRKLMDRKGVNSFTLNALESFMFALLFADIIAANPYEANIKDKIINAIYKQL